MSKSPPPMVQRLPFFYGWVVIAIAFVTMAIGANARTAFSILFPPIFEEFGWDRGTISAAFSIGFATSVALSPFIGYMMDRLGPRWVLPIGAILVSLGLTTSTLGTAPWHFFVTLGVLVVGGSVFMSYIGHTLFLPNWFDRKRGFAIGVAFSGVGIGSIVLFPWMQRIIDAEGWREASIFLAIIVLVVLVPLNFLFQRHKPEDMGLVPDGGVHEDDKHGEDGKPGARTRIVDSEWVAIEWTLPRAIRTARFWWLLVAFFPGLYVWYAVQVHQTQYLQDIGISKTEAAVALGLVPLCGVVGQIGVGYLSDKIGREWAWTIALLGFMATYACLLLLSVFPAEWLMYVMVAAQGILGYGLASVYGAIPAELFGGKHYGSIFGVIGAASGLGAALGPYATGILYDLQGSYDQSFVLAMAVCALSIFGMWMAAPRKVRLVAGRVRG